MTGTIGDTGIMMTVGMEMTATGEMGDMEINIITTIMMVRKNEEFTYYLYKYLITAAKCLYN